MIKNIQEWHYPESVERALALMKKARVIPYSGGTSFHRGGTVSAVGMISLRNVGLNFIEETGGKTMIGACARFSEIGEHDFGDGRNMLRTAASLAASNSLRNLITIGGSLASLPSWSNIPTPLLALNAEISLAGTNAAVVGIEDFLDGKLLDGTTLVTGIILPKAPGISIYARYARTTFDYAIADVAVYARVVSGRLKDVRIAVGNVFPKARRFPEIEEKLNGAAFDPGKVATIVDSMKFQPSANPTFSKEFRINLVKTMVKRAFEQIGEQAHEN
ncbi:MAG: FAD binding domain-containing protein [archaeon]